MTDLHLVIANKNYSSWSLRPWLAMAEKGVAFRESLIRLDEPGTAAEIARHSPSGRVPVLIHDGLHIWESLAILEYLAELYPDHGFWPRERSARALARSVCNEMHAGFMALRQACPMNLRRPRKPVAVSDGVLANVARIEAIWAQCRATHGKGGPFLFGEFSNADAMYAPVVTRLDTFALPVSAASREYMDAVMATAAFRRWKEAALAEPWIVPSDEVD
jgi:glutathione S-transferase